MSEQTTVQPVAGPPGPMAVLVDWALSTKAFKRSKVRPSAKVLAAALCNSGYSYREVAAMVGGMSHVAARDAYFSMLTSLREDVKRYRRAVAVDGCDYRASGRSFHVWLARDIDSGEIMDFSASPSASAEDGARFLSKVASMCTNSPFLRLGYGENAPRGLSNLDLYFQPSPGLSLIGRLGRLIKGARE